MRHALTHNFSPSDPSTACGTVSRAIHSIYCAYTSFHRCIYVEERSSDVVSPAMAACQRLPFSSPCLFINKELYQRRGGWLLRTTKRFFLTRREKLVSNILFYIHLWEDYIPDAELFFPVVFVHLDLLCYSLKCFTGKLNRKKYILLKKKFRI